jgi:hypothetical protein
LPYPELRFDLIARRSDRWIPTSGEHKMNIHESKANTTEQAIELYPDQKSKETADIMRRFNDVFQRHDPSELKELVAENCVIEKIAPDSDGDRCVGRDACVALWEGIATSKEASPQKPDVS